MERCCHSPAGNIAFILFVLTLAGRMSAFAQSSAESSHVSSTPKPDKSGLKFELNASGSHYFQATLLNQTWLRYTENNEGSTRFNHAERNTFDIGLRRTRIQLFGQITDHTFLYFQFGQNNFNSAFNSTSSRKVAAFFHDALCEYKVGKKDHLKMGAGLTIMNGLSRFSQPSIGSIMTLDVPVFLQYSVDQIDQFDRRLAVYVRGQIKKLDYRIYMADPFPITSNGSTAPAIDKNASFVNTAAFPAGKSPGIQHQYGGYLSYNFFDLETHITPYMAGTYLGAKKIFNIAVGGVFQQNALWLLKADTSGAYKDTAFADLKHWCIETYLDMPLNKEKGTAISAFAGYYHMDYGHHYLRYNGIMNPSTGSTAKNMLQSNAYGNAYPMFGTGQCLYAQFGILLPKKLLGSSRGQLMPYASAQYSDLDALQHKTMLVFDAGLNWFIKGHSSKISIDFQNRPTYHLDNTNTVLMDKRRSCFIVQYQIMI